MFGGLRTVVLNLPVQFSRNYGRVIVLQVVRLIVNAACECIGGTVRCRRWTAIRAPERASRRPSFPRTNIACFTGQWTCGIALLVGASA